MKKFEVAICAVIILLGILISAAVIFEGFNRPQPEPVVKKFCESGDAQTCCSDWAKENNVSILNCGGRWEFKNGLCSWICGKPQSCKNESECPQLMCFTEPCHRYSCVNNTCVVGD